MKDTPHIRKSVEGNAIHRLSTIRHVDIPAENLAVLNEGACSFVFGQEIEACYVALGQDPAAMAGHLWRQRRAFPWDRRWICDPKKVASVKVIAFAYRKTLNEVISTYSNFGQPCVEVTEADLPFLLDDINQIVIGHENPNLMKYTGWRLGLVDHVMQHQRYDEIMQLLKAPPTAKDACWLLNHRDKLYGRRTWIAIEALTWSVRIAEWDVLPCKAVHPDGNVIMWDNEWTSLPLSSFYDRYCDHVKLTDIDVLRHWEWQLRFSAARTRALEHDNVNEDDEQLDAWDEPDEEKFPSSRR